MIELRDELYAAPAYKWQHVPYTANRHKWVLHWYRDGRADLSIMFDSPAGRRYSFWTDGGKVTGADIARANGEMIASYLESWGDKPERMDAVLRLTPKHVLDRLFLLLDAIR